VDDGFLQQYLSLFDEFDVLAAFWVNIQLTFFAGILALILGTVLATMRISPVPSLQWAGSTYVTLLRNTPLTIIMVFCVLGLWGQLGITLSPDFTTNFFRLAVVGLTVYHAAFVCEALRSGVNAVSAGQAEAARSLGLTFGQNLRYVVLPQSWKASVVPLGSVIIAMIKNSALIGFFGVVGDLSQTADQLTSAEGYAFVPVAIGISIGYLIMTVPLGALLDRIERRQAVAAR
jgi:glutamate transport system permease protein